MRFPPLAASASCPLDVAERIDAIVTMDNPGIWILGTPRDDDRRNGMGIVVEDAGASDEPRWIPPAPVPWGYAIFGVSRSEEHTSELQSRPHLVCRLLLEKKKAN